MTREKIYKLRELIVKAAASLEDEDALEGVELFEEWDADMTYFMGDRVRYNGKLYRCEQGHTSRDGWEPDVTPALWTQVAKPGEIPVWRQPTGAQDAYNTGDRVHFPDIDSPVYRSKIDGNVWSPSAYPDAWEME